MTASETTKSASEQPIEMNSSHVGLDSALVERAVQALIKHHEKEVENSQTKSLLGVDRPFQVQFTLQRTPGQSSPKPIRVMIPHPLFQLSTDVSKEDIKAKTSDFDDDANGPEEAEVCLIVKEESKPWVQEMIEKFPNHMGCIKKVLGLQSLRKKHAQYEQQRELMNKYNLFLADDRILPMLGKALGKNFYKYKKLPIPIALTRKEALPFAVQRALSATFMTISQGNCITIRAGHTGMPTSKLVENVLAIAENAVPSIPHKWANIQVIGIKTPESVCLPVYNKTPEALLELAKLAGIKTTPKAEEVSARDEKPNNKRATEGRGNSSASPGTKRKNVGDLKSPLVRALKKQKQLDREKNKESNESKEIDTAANEKEGGRGEQTKTTKQSKKQKKKRRSVDGSFDKETPDEERNAKKQSLNTKAITKGENDNELQSTAEQTNQKPKQKTGKPKDAAVKNPDNFQEPAQKTENKASDETISNKVFVPSKKFKGSKKGYVFRMGNQGLGYYIDVKPMVDKMAMDALKRTTHHKTSRRGGTKKNKYKGTRRF